MTKLRSYQRCQVPHHWIVDPTAAVLMVYRWGEAGYTLAITARRDERVFAEPFEAVELQVGLLFGDDPE